MKNKTVSTIAWLATAGAILLFMFILFGLAGLLVVLFASGAVAAIEFLV